MQDPDPIIAGKWAEGLLADEMFDYTMGRVATRVASDWMRAEDVDEREKAWHKQKAVAEFRHELETIVSEGVTARATRDAAETGDRRLAATPVG